MTGTTFIRAVMTLMRKTMMLTVALLAANRMMKIRMGLPMRDPSAPRVHRSVAGRHLPVRIITRTQSLQIVGSSNTRQMNMGPPVTLSWAPQAVLQGNTSPSTGAVLAVPRNAGIPFSTSPTPSGSRRLLPPRLDQAVQGSPVRFHPAVQGSPARVSLA